MAPIKIKVRQFVCVKNVQSWEIISSTFVCMDEVDWKISIPDFIPDIPCWVVHVY